DLVARCIFERRNIAAIDKPPPVNPSKRRPTSTPNQMSFPYA
ncbi:MAG: IS4 family transposase, partial [Mesorhizobium sp.]